MNQLIHDSLEAALLIGAASSLLGIGIGILQAWFAGSIGTRKGGAR